MANSGSETRQRAMTLSTRVSQTEKHAIHARAAAYGLSAGRFMRMLCMDQPLPRATRFTQDQAEFIAFMLASTAVIASEIRRVEAHEGEPCFALILDQIAQIRTRCFEMLRRSP